MENEPKYYTPTIDEFHVGFEYEVRLKSLGIDWIKCTVECNWTYGNDKFIRIPNIGHWESNDIEHLRVWYLSQEDIESLGFKHDANDDGEEYPSRFEEHGYSKGYHIDTQRQNDTAIILHHFPDMFCIIHKIYKCGGSNIFEGYIKNKSELKVLLRQLVVI